MYYGAKLAKSGVPVSFLARRDLTHLQKNGIQVRCPYGDFDLRPVVGAAAFTWLQDAIIRATDYWRAVLGLAILALVLAFPQGIAGALGPRIERVLDRGRGASRAPGAAAAAGGGEGR